MPLEITLAEVEAALHRIWIGQSSARLRKEDKKKALELVALLSEIRRRLPTNLERELTLLDAAAGKSYVGILSAELLLTERRAARVITLEKELRRVEQSQEASKLVRGGAIIECVHGDVADVSIWPHNATLVVALHACGGAADAVIESSIAAGAKALLLAPCCTSSEAKALARAVSLAERLGVPAAAPVRRRFLQSIVDAERSLRLEAAGYRVEVVEFVAPTVTPHNLLYRAVLTHDQGRAERARQELVRLLGERPSTSQR